MGRKMAIDQVAAGWVAREDRGPLTPQEAAERDAWLDASARHFGAYARAHAMFRRMDRARGLGDGFDPAQHRPVAARSATAGLLSRVGRRMRWAALAASVLVGVLLMATLLPQQRGPAVHRTALGEVLRLPLADGSAVTLNSASEIRVEYSASHRHISLLQGEALFDVARDVRRPFVVAAAGVEVVAVGTSFSVRRELGEALQVTVREGVVEVVQPGRADSAVRVAANFAASARQGAGVHVQPLGADQVDRRLAWRQGMLAFDGDTLGQAAATFARYNQTRILISDPRVAERRVVGLYSATDPAGFAQAVATALDLRLETTRDGLHLRQVDSSSAPAAKVSTQVSEQ
ncbi:MAG: FecR family protein [Lysobacter sp.]